MSGIVRENFTAADVPSVDAIWSVGSRPEHVLVRSTSKSSPCIMEVAFLIQLIRVVVIPCMLAFISCHLWSVYNTCSCDDTSCKPLPPGRYGLPVIGETLNFLIMGRSFFDSRRVKYGNVFKTHILGKPTVRVIGPHNVKQILRGENNLVATQWPRSTCILLGEGCISHASGRNHATRKKALVKTLSGSALSGYVPIIQEVTRLYIRKWCRQKCIMGCPEFKKMNFEVSSRVLVGFQMVENELESLMGVFETFISNLFSLPLNIPGFGFRRGLQARETLLQKIESVITRKQSEENFDEITALDILMNIEGKEKLSLTETKNICLELLFAGHETTSSACCALVLQIAKHPAVRKKLEEELSSLGLESPGCRDDLDIETLNKLTYANNVVKEVLRLVPPVGAGFRRALKTFEIDGYQIPKDWCVTYSIRDTHETTEVFQNSNKFDPDRWNNSRLTANDYQYLPFGGGKRLCAGKALAQLVLKIFTVELVRCSLWTVANPDTTFSTFPVPYPKDNLPVVFKSLENESKHYQVLKCQANLQQRK